MSNRFTLPAPRNYVIQMPKTLAKRHHAPNGRLFKRFGSDLMSLVHTKRFDMERS